MRSKKGGMFIDKGALSRLERKARAYDEESDTEFVSDRRLDQLMEKSKRYDEMQRKKNKTSKWVWIILFIFIIGILKDCSA